MSSIQDRQAVGPEITGSCDAAFVRVKEAFAETLAGSHELGGAVAVVVGGRTVVDLWGGFADRARTKPWTERTLVNVFSTTKGLVATAAARLVEDGLVDLDAPLARLWPELRAEVTLRMLLSHRAGLPAVREPLPQEALFDWDHMTRALAREEPWWAPGTAHGYHAVTFGWLVGEVIRRASGRRVREYVREAVTGPLGIEADLQIGLDERDDARCAELKPGRRTPGVPTLFDRIAQEPESMTAKAFVNPITMVLPDTVSSRAWRSAEIPAVNGHATARAVARLYGALAGGSALAGGGELLPREAVARSAETCSHGPDLVLGVSTRFGLGFMLPQESDPFARPGSLGHPGAGGSIGFADPSAQLGVGYVMNRGGVEILTDPRAQALSDAIYACL